mgnify:CR=1 FL=1
MAVMITFRSGAGVVPNGGDPGSLESTSRGAQAPRADSPLGKSRVNTKRKTARHSCPCCLQEEEKYKLQMKLRRDALEESFKRNELEQQKMLKEEKELDKQSRENVMALSYGPSRLFLAPFEEILAPVQKMLYEWCVFSRCISSVVTWSDSVVAFWIATVALLASALLFFVPWTFLFRWGFRIVSIAVLGPWMKLVDISFIKNDDDDSMTYEERKAKMEVEMQERYDFIVGDSRIRRIFKERSMKFRDMEKYLFGKVRLAWNVPFS